MTKKKQIDPKSINVPNICFTVEDDDKKRDKKYKKQRLKRGFDDSELWNLDHTIACFVLPRLKVFRQHLEKRSDHPATVLGSKEWKEIVDVMIYAFEQVKTEMTPQKDLKVVKGMELFGKYIYYLWD